MLFDFSGTTALVTGGTSGIGHGTALLLRDSGAQVTITGTRSGPEDYDVDLSGLKYRQLALTDANGIDALAEEFTELDILVNNAGANFPGGLDESTPRVSPSRWPVNLLAPFRLTERLVRRTEIVERARRGQRGHARVHGGHPIGTGGARVRIGEGWSARAHPKPRREMGR